MMKWGLGILAVIVVVIYFADQSERRKIAERRIALLEKEQQDRQTERDRERKQEEELERRRLQTENAKRTCPSGFAFEDISQDCRDNNGCTPQYPHSWMDSICRTFPEPPQVRVVNSWLQAQRNGGSGVQYWDPDMAGLGGAKTLYNVKSWEIIDYEDKPTPPHKFWQIKFRVQASTQGGFAIDKVYIADVLTRNKLIMSLSNSNGMVIP